MMMIFKTTFRFAHFEQIGLYQNRLIKTLNFEIIFLKTAISKQNKKKKPAHKSKRCSKFKRYTQIFILIKK